MGSRGFRQSRGCRKPPEPCGHHPGRDPSPVPTCGTPSPQGRGIDIKITALSQGRLSQNSEGGSWNAKRKGMSQEIRANYEQMDLLPQSLEDWVPADHPACATRVFSYRLHIMTAWVLLPDAKTHMMTRDCRDVLSFELQCKLKRRPSALKPQAGPRRWKCCRSLL